MPNEDIPVVALPFPSTSKQYQVQRETSPTLKVDTLGRIWVEIAPKEWSQDNISAPTYGWLCLGSKSCLPLVAQILRRFQEIDQIHPSDLVLLQRQLSDVIRVKKGM